MKLYYGNLFTESTLKTTIATTTKRRHNLFNTYTNIIKANKA